MQYLRFCTAEVKAILDHSKASQARSPSLDQLFDPDLRFDGKEPAAGTWPTADDVDSSRIPYGLWLVADQGVYLMSNGTPGFMLSETPVKHRVCYAEGINPENDPFDDWYETKRCYMGGDDQSLFIDGDRLNKRLQQGSEVVLIGVLSNGMHVIQTDI